MQLENDPGAQLISSQKRVPIMDWKQIKHWIQQKKIAENIALVREVDDALQIFSRNDGAGRIGGRVEYDGLGLGRDKALDRVCRDAEVLGFLGFEINDLAAGVLDDVFEADPVGDGQDDFIAVVDEDLHGIEEGMLLAGGEDGFVDGVVGAKVVGMAVDDGFADVRDAGDNGIAGEVGLDGRYGRVLDMAGRGKMRFAGAEIDQVDAFGAELGGFSGDRHGGGDFNAADAVGEDLRRTGDCHGPSIFTDFAADGNRRA